MAPNVGPDAALINRPGYSVTENPPIFRPLASADGVCYAGSTGIDRIRLVIFMTDFTCALP
jgi:hypothetical protein